MMDRTRFDELLAAYGADFRRWPEAERAAGEAFAAAHASELAEVMNEARQVDSLLALSTASGEEAPELLTRRILARAPKPVASGFDRRAMMALAACAVLGVIAGYSGGLFAPPADADDSYFTAAFQAPIELPSGDEG